MNSERRTDNLKRNSKKSAYMRRRKKRIILFKGIAMIVGLIVVVLFIVIGIVNILNSRIKDYYNDEEGYARVYETDFENNELKPFAAELAVVKADSAGLDTVFSAESGLLVSKGEMESRYSYDPFKKMNPASTTKIMTALLALKYGKLTDQVTVPQDSLIDEYGASLAGIKPGQTLSLGQLLYGLMLPSGNDAANAIAVHIGGSVDGFVNMMNEEAQALGCVDTHFANAHGMTDDAHYTTAYDLYLMTNEALKYDEFKKICSTKLYVAEFWDTDGLAVSKTWENTNKYLNEEEQLRSDLSVVAGKTGTTMAAGNCLVLVTEDSSGRDYISIVLKSDSKDSLYSNMNYLLAKID